MQSNFMPLCATNALQWITVRLQRFQAIQSDTTTRMTQPSPPEIPQEIIDEVIDLCSGDRRTLMACSLISRAWVYRARGHLFSTLILNHKTLLTWCSIVMTPTPNTDSEVQPLTHAICPASPSYAPSRLSSHVISLKLVPAYTQTPSNRFEAALLRANTHLSAFINLTSLTLSSISFVAFQDASLRACFESFAEPVCKLKLSNCVLDGKVPAFLKLFAHLEALELDANLWIGTPQELPDWASISQEDMPVLRGSFTASGFTNSRIGLLDCLSTMRLEYHTITLGYNPTSAFQRLNTLFTKCKDHLKTLALTAADSIFRRSGFDLSPCGELVEIHVQFSYAKFAPVIATLRTVSSRRFRKLTLLITPPIPKIGAGGQWSKLDEEVTMLAKRVKATARNNTLEVMICCYLTDLGGTELSEIEEALPLISRNDRVSLRTEYLPPPLTQRKSAPQKGRAPR